MADRFRVDRTRSPRARFLGDHDAPIAIDSRGERAFHAAVLWTSRVVKRTMNRSPRRRRRSEAWIFCGLAAIAAVVLALAHRLGADQENAATGGSPSVRTRDAHDAAVFVLMRSRAWCGCRSRVGGMRPRAAQIVQPIAQFMRPSRRICFPSRCTHRPWKLNPDIILESLMILAQWYILFNAP